MEKNQLLRSIPKVDELLKNPALAALELLNEIASKIPEQIVTMGVMSISSFVSFDTASTNSV